MPEEDGEPQKEPRHEHNHWPQWPEPNMYEHLGPLLSPVLASYGLFQQSTSGAKCMLHLSGGNDRRPPEGGNDTCHAGGNLAKTAVTARRTRSSECSMSSSLSSFFAHPCHTGR